MKAKDKEFMQMAIALAHENIDQGGGPFGAVIVKDGEVVATGVNRVTVQMDATAHAEVTAIRAACQKLHTFDLSGCDLYTSCEPCPMCLGAVYWAHLDRIVYGATKLDAARADFDDAFIYRELELPYAERRKPCQQLLGDEAAVVFDHWRSKTDKTPY